jgi:hypothetical protein
LAYYTIEPIEETTNRIFSVYFNEKRKACESVALDLVIVLLYYCFGANILILSFVPGNIITFDTSFTVLAPVSSIIIVKLMDVIGHFLKTSLHKIHECYDNGFFGEPCNVMY